MNIALKLAYDGSLFWGWQKTKQGPTIEEALQGCLEQILQMPITLQAASRTDRGVHADGQWVNFLCPKDLDPADLLKRLNALLPASIRVLTAFVVPDYFHPTLHAEKKEYHYTICLGPIQLPHKRFFAWHVPYDLDFQKIEQAIPFFLGKHDFSSFCNFRKNLNYPDKNRTIEAIQLHFPQENTAIFAITGNSFLYKMVRNIVGTLIYVGRGKILPEKIPLILASQLRADAGITAPAHGLTLKKIYYPREYKIEL